MISSINYCDFYIVFICICCVYMDFLVLEYIVKKRFNIIELVIVFW